jgi:sugar lactone lactonase YvrE
MRELLSSLVWLMGTRKQAAVASGLLLVVAVVLSAAQVARGAELLVADRLGNGVFRYSESGAFLGVVTQEKLVPGVTPEYLYQPTGIAISPDYSKFYVSSSQLNQVVAYDYDRFTGSASNPTIFADVNDGLSFPNDIQFSPDGSKIYVANLNGGVSRFHIDGSSAGEKLLLPTINGFGVTQASSMSFAPDGRMLAGAFSDPSGVGGGIAISNSDVSALPEYFVEPVPSIRGATGLMVHEGYLYVSGLFAASIRRFSLSDGVIDSNWEVTGPDVSYPQDLIVAPDGNGFLAGILGAFPGAGRIARYDFDGTPLGTFALPSQNGFREATAMVAVPTSLEGDYNDDGMVDAADYTIWRDALASGAALPNDETPGVGIDDYERWRENFGSSLPGGAVGLGAAVPEPGVCAMLLLVAMVAIVRRNRS